MSVPRRSACSRWWLFSLKALAVATSLTGCARSALSRGAECYTQKRYIDAAQIFEHNEPELAAYEDGDKARYGVYRGLTLLALGDEAEGQRWLLYGTTLAQTTLPPGERTRLITAASAPRRNTASGPTATPAPVVGARD